MGGATPAAAQSQSAGAEMPSVRSLFTDLGQDVAHLRTWGTVETLAVGGGIAAALKHEDARLTRHVAGARDAEEILDAEMVNAPDLGTTVERFFDRADTAFLHVRFPTYGCFALRIDRASVLE